MIACAKCEVPLVAAGKSADGVDFCSRCQRKVEVFSFSRAIEAGSGLTGASRAKMTISDTQAPCFFHEGKRAETTCGGCGRYLCADCAADWIGQTLCLTCIHANREVKKSDAFQNKVTLYDNIAFALVVFPWLFFLFYGALIVIATAPVALYLLVTKRKSSRGIVPRGRGRAITAGLLGTIFLGGWVALAVYLMKEVFLG